VVEFAGVRSSDQFDRRIIICGHSLGESVHTPRFVPSAPCMPRCTRRADANSLHKTNCTLSSLIGPCKNLLQGGPPELQRLKLGISFLDTAVLHGKQFF